jgi:intraflagellar transport protein 80
MAIQGRHLDSVQIALASLVEVGKLEFFEHTSKKIASEEGKAAAIALYRRCPDEAETILLQAKPPLLYRAIKMNIRLFRWNRALDIALKYKKHVDTVIGYRARYLERFGKTETNSKFLQYSKEVEVNWETIKAKIANEKDDERARSGMGGRTTGDAK